MQSCVKNMIGCFLLKATLAVVFILLFVFTSANKVSIFKPAYAQEAVDNNCVLINEFSSYTQSDWIEIINACINQMDLSVYLIRDSTLSNKKILNGILESGGVMSFSFSNYLNIDKDTIKLIKISNGTEIVVDSISYGGDGEVCVPTPEGSIGRYQDGGNVVDRFLLHTKDLSNNSAVLDPCPAPTDIPDPTSTKIPTSTKSPTATKTPTPTKIPTLSPTPKLSSSTFTTSVTVSGTVLSDATDEAQILSATDSADSLNLGIVEPSTEPTPTIMVANELIRNMPIPALIFIAGGLVMVIGAVFMFIRREKRSYNFDSEKKSILDPE